MSYFNARYYDADTGRFITPDPTVPNPESTQHYNRYMFVCGNPISFVDMDGYQQRRGGNQDAADAQNGNNNNENSVWDDFSQAISDTWNDITGGESKDQKVNGKNDSGTTNFAQSLSDAVMNFGNSVSAAYEMATTGKKWEDTEGATKIQQHFENRYGAYMSLEGNQLHYRTKGWEHTWGSWSAYSGLPSNQNSTQAQRLVGGSNRPLPDGKWTLSAYDRYDPRIRNNGFKDGKDGNSSYSYNGVNFASNDLTTDIANNTRDYIQLHPDGSDSVNPATYGCIGLRGTASELRKFKSTVRNYLSRRNTNNQYYHNSIDVYVDY